MSSLMKMSRITRNIISRRVHASAQQGFTAASSNSYEHGRPEYSDESLRQLVRILRKSGPAQDITDGASYKIVELGAGTGKFTQSFARFASDSNNIYNARLRYLATEPSEGFRTMLAEKNLANVKVKAGTGDAIPAKEHTTHMVVVAQAFHWMANRATLQEVHRVLQPGGSLVLVWNTYDYRHSWLRDLDTQILTPAYERNNTPRQQSEQWRQCFVDASNSAITSTTTTNTTNSNSQKIGFSNVHSWYKPYVHKGDRNMIIQRILSTSVIAEQTPEEQAKVLVTLNRILDTHSGLQAARETGQFSMPYITQLSWLFKQ